MSDSNKILLFSDYLFFTKTVELPISIKQKDIAFFVENELEASSPIPIDFLKWSYLRTGGSLLIFASTSDRLAQAGHTHEDMEQAQFAIPEAGLLAKADFADGWNIVKMPKAIDAIYVEKGEWKNFVSVELASGDAKEQCEAFAKQNGIEAYKLYSFDGYSLGSFSSLILNLKGENCASIKSKLKMNRVLQSLDLRDDAILKDLRDKIIKAAVVSYLIKAVPLAVVALAAMQVNLHFKQKDLSELEVKVAQLAPEAKKLQDVSDQVDSARNFAKGQLFNALLIARINNLRPIGISFSKTSAKSAAEMTVQGESTNLMLLNEYISSLQNEDFIEKVDVETSSKSSGAKFKLNIKFKELS